MSEQYTFNEPAALRIAETVRRVCNTPYQAERQDQTQDGGANLALWKLTTTPAVAEGEKEYKATGSFVCWTGDYYTGSYATSNAIPDQKIYFPCCIPNAGYAEDIYCFAVFRNRWEAITSGSGSQKIDKSYGGMKDTTTACGGQWTVVKYAASQPATSDLTLSTANGTITFSVAGTYQVSCSLSIKANARFYSPNPEWQLRLRKNASTAIHTESSHYHSSGGASIISSSSRSLSSTSSSRSSGSGTSSSTVMNTAASGHCAFTVLVSVAASDTLVMEWLPATDTNGAYKGDATSGAFTVHKV